MAKTQTAAEALRAYLARACKKGQTSRAEWCREHDFDPTTITNILSERRKPGRGLASRIEQATGVKVSSWDARVSR